ncbi:putative internal virion protein D [Erwinia phage pEp_SNUABM_04]|nr:putative internal virion protein D [Erwinia phage pEp_SNUABM_04]
MEKYNPNQPSEYDGDINVAADTHGVSPTLLRKLLWNESRFNAKAVSKTGPRGIAQFTKATGAAYGLHTEEDFFDATKSINASAQHLAELVGKFKGDELKAALAYNQGEGSLGGAQLQAYDKGDYGSISEEGRNYMRNLLDVAQSPNAGNLESFGGITPKGKGIPSEQAFSGIGKKSKVGDTLPESQGFQTVGVERPAPNQPFSKDFLEKTGMTQQEYEGRSTFFGFGNAAEAEVSNSVAGMAFRAGRLDNGFDVFKDTITPTKWNSHQWTPEELAKMRKEVKDPRYLNVVTGGSPENLDALIKLANENFEADARASDAGLGAKLSAGVVGAAFDPLSYVPIVGQAGKGFSLAKKALVVGAQSGALNVASEGLRTSIAGGDADYKSALLGGFVFGAGMSALADGVARGLRGAGRPEPVNEFAPIVARMEARETAINTGGADLSRMTVGDHLDFRAGADGVDYAPHPTLPGSVVLRDGSILSDANLLNPKTIADYAAIAPEKARRGISTGGFTEIGQRLHRSDSPEVRGIANDLVRPIVGSAEGGMGKFGATASDIKERLHFTNQRVYNEMFSAVDAALKDPEWSVGMFKTSKTGARQEIFKRAALAIERPELQGNLTPAERKVMDIMKNHFDTKREMMENPAMFGNANAKSIFPESRHVGTYVPNVYSREAKMLMLNELGADGLQKAIKESWLTSYRVRPEVKKRVDEMIMESNPEMKPADLAKLVEEYAHRKAYGISHTDQFNASSVIDDNLTGLVGLENNNFLEARNLFDSDMPITLPSGNQFSVNDLRDFDMKHIMPAYDRRIDGDIAVMGGSGKTTAELKDMIMQLDKKAEHNGTMKGEVEALKDTMKILTGRARRNTDGAIGTTLRAFSDLGFFAKNAYMGVQNLTEIASMLAKGNVRSTMNAIPMLGDWMQAGRVMKAKELREVSSVLFGKELDDAIRPTRSDIIQRMRDASDTPPAVANVVGTFKFGTQELAARSPWTKTLNGTTNYILNAARQGFLSDAVEGALKGGKVKWADEKYLRSASVSKEQWNDVLAAIRQHTKLDENGHAKIVDKKAFANDPRTMNLWRLADRIADETIMRPHKVSSQDSVAYGPLVKLAMQFKNFTIKSLNARFMRDYYSATKDGRTMDVALSWMISFGLAGAYYVGSTHMKAMGLPEDQRKEYLSKALDPAMIAYASASRSAQAGAPMSAVNMISAPLGFDQGKYVRSTILPKDDSKVQRDKAATSRDLAGEFGGALLQQVPGAMWGMSAASAGYNAYGVLTAPAKYTERDYMTGLMNSVREIVPNDPLTQQMLIKVFESQGIHSKDTKR